MEPQRSLPRSEDIVTGSYHYLTAAPRLYLQNPISFSQTRSDLQESLSFKFSD
jgi:hypothetical protein